MARVQRVEVGAMVYHAWNRANFRSALFKKEGHYQDFLGVLKEGLSLVPMRLLAYCLMPNHWHMVLYPRADGDLSRFMQRITLTHTQRYHAQTRTVGYGHIYQGRYKSLPVEMGGHFLTLVRYVESNAQRAALVKKAEDWPWSSVYVRLYGDEGQKAMLSPWPVTEPKDYVQGLNHSPPKEEIANIRYAIKRSRPYGSERWVSRAVAECGLENTIRNPWRPGKGTCPPFSRRRARRRIREAAQFDVARASCPCTRTRPGRSCHAWARHRPRPWRKAQQRSAPT